MLNASLGSTLNASSGYESAGNDTSLLDPCYSTPVYPIKVSDLIQLDPVQPMLLGGTLPAVHGLRRERG